MSPYPVPVAEPLSSAHRVRRVLLRVAGRLSRRPAPPSGPLRKVLVIRPDHLGDLLFATPAIARLRELHPEAEIVGMVGPWGEAVWRRLPEFDRLITCPFPGFTRRPKGNPLAPYLLLARCARRIRAEGFDTALVLRFDHWWGAALAALAGIPRRIGYDQPDVLPFLTDLVPYSAGRHEVIQNWALVEGTPDVDPTAIGPIRFPVSDDARRKADDLLLAEGVEPGEPILVVHPGSGAPVKLWEPEKWAAVADAIAGKFGARPVITGGAGEIGLATEIAGMCAVRAVALAGKTDLDALAAVLSRAVLVMGPDSGPLHLAVAVGAPTVALYGPADPALFGPWGPPEKHQVVMSDWPCAPCGRLDFPPEELSEHRCVRDIPVERVIEAVERVLESAFR